MGAWEGAVEAVEGHGVAGWVVAEGVADRVRRGVEAG